MYVLCSRISNDRVSGSFRGVGTGKGRREGWGEEEMLGKVAIGAWMDDSTIFIPISQHSRHDVDADASRTKLEPWARAGHPHAV